MGTSLAHERQWGWIGGTLGFVYGVGAALIGGTVVARWHLPPFFAAPRLLVFDAYRIVGGVPAAVILIPKRFGLASKDIEVKVKA